MERMATYKKLDDNRVERTRTVKEIIILRGSNASLEVQIKSAEEDVKYHHDVKDENCQCVSCLMRNDDIDQRIADAEAVRDERLALWKAATGKDYPES